MRCDMTATPGMTRGDLYEVAESPKKFASSLCQSSLLPPSPAGYAPSTWGLGGVAS